MPIRIGVLALQGAFQLHRVHIEAAGADYVEVVGARDLESINGIILPGGESGTMLKLIDFVGIHTALAEFLESKPAWGICAGAILMAKTVCRPTQKSFGSMDVEIERNAYGRQRESSEEMVDGYKVSYIRAPKIRLVGPSVSVLATRGESPSWVECGNQMITTFHPEVNLMAPSPWHERLVRRGDPGLQLQRNPSSPCPQSPLESPDYFLKRWQR